MKRIKQMRIPPNARASAILSAMKDSGVLGGGRLARAADIIREMFTNPDYTVFLSLAGPVVAGGLRTIIATLLQRGFIHVVVTNGANITHDLAEAFGEGHYQGSLYGDDVQLRREGITRIADIHMRLETFSRLEKETHRLLESISNEVEGKISPSTLLAKMGERLKDENSILWNAQQQHVPVISPGVMDSMLGMHIWTFCQLKKLDLDFLADMKLLADKIFTAKKIGTIILGGGTPKHFTLGAATLRGGVDAAVQITTDHPEAGSLSGAPLSEGITWNKVKPKGHFENVNSDFTIAFPLLIAAVLTR